jgi:hypothetical protein
MEYKNTLMSSDSQCLCTYHYCTLPAKVTIRFWNGVKDSEGRIESIPIYVCDVYCIQHSRDRVGQPDHLYDFGTSYSSAMAWIDNQFAQIKKQFIDDL